MPIDPYFLKQMAGEPDRHVAEQPPCCPECGYDLRGVSAQRPCPECGWTASGDSGAARGSDDAEEGTPCAKCGNRVEGLPLGATCENCTVGRPHGSAVSRVCQSCGYDLKGLGADSACPECGAGAEATRAAPTRLLALPVLDTQTLGTMRFRLGTFLLMLLGLGWMVVVVARTLGLIGEDGWLITLRIWGSGLLIAGVLATPSAADGPARSWMRPMRWITRILLIGFPFAAFAHPDTVAAVAAFGGLLGLAGLLWLMAMYARVVELEQTSRRFELGWIFCLPCGVLAWFLPFPGHVANLPQSVVGYVVMFFVLFMLIPTWMMSWFLFRPAETMWRASEWAARYTSQQVELERRRSLRRCEACGASLEPHEGGWVCPTCPTAG
ncbi:MAG: hypothetical protein MK101_01085 [Phycisphaerales bacterium]|nr:hypothetical protein [Phycisphaerales bacterium]